MDKELFEVLNKCECHLSLNANNELLAWACIRPYDIKEFCNALGKFMFDDGGIECRLLDGYIAVNLVDIFEYLDEKCSDYSICFDDWDWSNYKDKVLECEKEEG